MDIFDIKSITIDDEVYGILEAKCPLCCYGSTLRFSVHCKVEMKEDGEDLYLMLDGNIRYA